MAALASVFALATASESQRPFLNVSDLTIYWSQTDGRLPTSVSNIDTRVGNTGVFPADNVSLTVDIWKVTEEHDKRSYELRGENTSIIFPNEDTERYRFEEANHENSLLLKPQEDKLQIRITINYRNKLTDKNHKTTRMYVSDFPYSKGTPLSEGSHWE